MENMLTIDKICGYLPYGLNLTFEGDETQSELVGLSIKRYGAMVISSRGDYGEASLNEIKPILYDISCLTEEIEVNGERFVPLEKLISTFHLYMYQYIEGNFFSLNYGKFIKIDELPYNVIQKLYSWHFDLFDLIGKGLAIDKKTLK